MHKNNFIFIKKLITTLVSSLLNFYKLFKIEYDFCDIDIRDPQSQKVKLVTIF